MTQYDLGVFIGRFRPLHNGHRFVIREALKKSKYLTIIVGSCHGPRSHRNPFIFQEVQGMIRGSLSPAEQARVLIQSSEDYPYNDTIWMEQIHEKVGIALSWVFERTAKEDMKTALFGFKKDDSTQFLDWFPQWSLENMELNNPQLNATQIREGLFLEDFYEFEKQFAEHLPDNVFSFLEDFSLTSDYAELQKEYEYIREYKKNVIYSGKYPQIISCVDAMVVQSGHVLLVKRKALPGRGLWALPGGHLNEMEQIEDAWLRELEEETQIVSRGKVPEKVLRGSLQNNGERFAHPHRSAKGRVRTDVFLVHLPPGPLPKVRGSDDAELAKWWPLGELTRDMFFEDHFSIIDELKNDLRDPIK